MNREELLKIAKPLVVNREVAKLLPQKTMTRRILKPQPSFNENSGFSWKGAAYGIGANIQKTELNFTEIISKYHSKFKPGDILWIREPVKIKEVDWGADCGECYIDAEPNAIIEYADGYTETFWLPARIEDIPNWFDNGKSVPNGCLKEMARYFVKIVDVRVERLQDISVDDIVKEGYWKNGVSYEDEVIKWFKNIWNSTAPKGYKWEDNPFVFVYEWEYL